MIQSGCGGWSEPKTFQTMLNRALNRPYTGFSSACFQSSAEATGTIRNGAISSVRTSAAAAERPVQQQGQQQAQEQAGQHHRDGQDDR